MNLKLLILLTFLIFNFSQPGFSQGYLHCDGKYIFDGSGNEVILRGIGTGNWMIQEGYMMQTAGVAGTQHEFRNKLINTIGEAKTDSFYTAWLGSHFRRIDVDSMKSWGFNSVRVAMHYKWFTPPIEDEPVPGEITWLETGFTLMDSLLAWCSDNEMYLILDMHGAPGGQGENADISDYDPSKPSLWESPLNKEKTIALWKKLAERYSTEPWIGGYDLINETNWTFPEGNNSKLRELMVNITEAIREVDQNHIIFIEGNSFANDFSGLTPPWDNNMAYSFHKYWNYNTQESLNFAISLRNAYNIPIWLGETGENSNVWFTNLIALCEKNRIGWSWWPVKKPGINNPLKVKVNSDYTNLINYWRGTATNPGIDPAFEAVLQFAENHRLENCTFQKDVVDAMIRQPFSTETIPFKTFTTGEPVFASDYNLGRNGYAYFDNDTANYRINTGEFTDWNKGWSYRNDGVDIEPCTDSNLNNGFSVGWTSDGEWMEYTIVSDSTAGYTLDIRSASGSSGSNVHLEVNGIIASQAISLPGTGGWYNWQTTTTNGIILPKGTNKVKFIFEKGGSNLNYFKFSNPVETNNIPFVHLSAETSTDGASVFLTLNKEVTSETDEIIFTDFLVTINNLPVEIDSIFPTAENHLVIQINLKDKLYYGGTITLSYQGNSVLHTTEPLEPFSNVVIKNNLPVRYNLPGRIQSEDYHYNNGMVSETCTDIGGGLNMGYAAPGDYLDYLVHVTESGFYNLNFRVASQRASSQLIIRVGEDNNFTGIDTVTITSTNGWQIWKTVQTTAYFEAGRYTVRMYVRSGEFNTNWFEAVKAPPTVINSQKTNDINIYPNPAVDRITILFPGLPYQGTSVSIYNSLGQMEKRIDSIETSPFHMDISSFRKGKYFVVIKNNNTLVFSSILIVR